ncbi:uncharacterized protein N7483_008134 [Penicillium malachiteum]|uniref:uncharacterized protein n=1 Tax=Penicillium malachiteum TaxID=1324776 RepID=UPI002548B073|nr:uncharacterized protein N7483_008134 [Penicillium malachiteum]KAJ5720200.1 hypothetical protein N7483_008134 [Penicillium malachiteum]
MSDLEPPAAHPRLAPIANANWRTPRDRQLAAGAPHRLSPNRVLGLAPPARAAHAARQVGPANWHAPSPVWGGAPSGRGGRHGSPPGARAGWRGPSTPGPGVQTTPPRVRAPGTRRDTTEPCLSLRRHVAPGGPSVRGHGPPTGPGPDFWPDLASLHTLRPHLGRFYSNLCSSVQKFVKKRDLVWGWTVHWDRPPFQAPTRHGRGCLTDLVKMDRVGQPTGHGTFDVFSL